MEPLVVIDSLHKEFPTLPKIDLSDCGNLLAPANALDVDLSKVRAPFPRLIVGMKVEPVAAALAFDPQPAELAHLGTAVEVGFLVTNGPPLNARSYYVNLLNGLVAFGAMTNCDISIDEAGKVVPATPLIRHDLFNLLCGRYFGYVATFFWLFQNTASLKLQGISFDLSRRERHERRRLKLPPVYLQPVEVGTQCPVT